MCFHNVTKSYQFCDTVCTEWLLYATGTALDSAVDLFPNNICVYWLHVSNMVDTVEEKKYKNLSYIAKAALTLSHSNTSPERGLSVNNALVTKEWGSLS